MAGRTEAIRENRVYLAVVVASLLAVAASAAEAQPCPGKLPEASAALATPRTTKFSLITAQCPALAEPGTVRRAEQLELTDRSVSIRLDAADPAPAAPPPAPAASAAAPSDHTPLGKEGKRVLALAPALHAAARAHDLDPLLLHAIAHVESRHNAQAVSPAGARGVMQVMPATGKRFGVADPDALHDAETNLRASAAYLRNLRVRFGDDLRLVLAAYNAGEGAVEKHGRDVPPYAETQAYVRDVLALYRRLAAQFTVSASGSLVAKGI